MKIIKLLRLDNLVLLALVLFAFRYGFLMQQDGLVMVLNEWQYALMVLACILVGAGAYLINTIADTDKPEVISESAGYNLYATLNIAAAGIGYYLADHIGNSTFVAIFIVAAAIAYWYATNLKQTPIISNLIIALVIPIAVFTIAVFNLYPLTKYGYQPLVPTLFSLITDFAIITYAFAVLYSFTKDMATTNSDYNAGNSTLPILLGKERTSKLLTILMLIPIGLIFYYTNQYLKDLLYAVGYGLLFIIGPLIYYIIKMWGATSQKEYVRLATVLKLILFFTGLSVIIITYNIQHNA